MQKRSCTILSALFLVVFSTSLCLGDVYKVTDAEGNHHYTDVLTSAYYANVSTVVKDPKVLKNWYSMASDTFTCSPDESPASLLSKCNGYLKCKAVDEVIRNGKPVVVRVLLDDGNLQGEKLYFKSKSLCLSESKTRRQQREKLLERYR